jgi:hypothetical protein
MHFSIVDAMEDFLLRYFTYEETIRIKDVFTYFSAFFGATILSLFLFMKTWLKSNVRFENFKDKDIEVIRFSKGENFETQIRKPQTIAEVIDVTLALLILNIKHVSTVRFAQVKRVEKIVSIIFAAALVVAIFGVFCAIDTQLPPGYSTLYY